MTKFAPVAPIQILEGMSDRRCLGTYHLLLTHHILEHPDRFAELFAYRPHSTIIVDNSIVELKDAASDAKVLEACKVMRRPLTDRGQRHYVIPVLTDVMGDGVMTRQLGEQSYMWWQENAPDYPLMVVLQGESWHDFCYTVDFFITSGNFPLIKWVGIPRKLVETLGTRQNAVRYVVQIIGRKDIDVHLLGFSDDVTDDIISAGIPGVTGIDSAVPLRYSYNQPEHFSNAYLPTSPIPPRPVDWFGKGVFSNVDAENLHRARSWFE
jgi:hypothetical protein